VDLAARRADIEARVASMDAQDYFKVLGVTPETPSSALQTAYFALAKAYHPDRLPAELADLRPVVARIFAQISEAYRTLSDPSRRAEYVSQGSPSSEHEDAAKVARVVDAALEFQKAESLLKSNDLAGAEALARKAFEADPEQPDHVALLTWIQAQRRPPPPPLREGSVSTYYDDLIKILDVVLSKDPQFERALFYRGTLLKRAGRIERALADFRLVAEINPRNIDAAREVRLHEMRTGSGGAKAPRPSGNPEAPEGPGIINKIFKR
jgi:DnaJ-domain-containing protein 1